MIPLLALLLDLACGEPPSRVHPVAWTGKLLDRCLHAPIGAGRRELLARGAAATLGIAALGAVAAAAIGRLARRRRWSEVLTEVMLLKSSFSLRRLLGATWEVGRALRRGDLATARALTGRNLVSRDTSSLSSSEVASAAIESLAENLTDSVLAPLVYYLVAGTPGAWAYRVINTADAMVGYRTARLEYLGKVAARADDVVNWLPARLAAVTIIVAAAAVGEDARAAAATMRRDRGRTASPNAGWTMSAMAGALGVTLAKRDAYRLGDGRAPTAPDVARALRIAGAASALLACGVVAISHARRRRAFSSV